MPRVTTEQIFAALFAVVSTAAGKDWSGTSIPLQTSTRNWSKVGDTADGIMPALYQLDPREERDVRTGLGRSRRMLHAQIDIRIQRQQPDQYSDSQPFSTLINNWVDNFYALFSPQDPGFGGGSQNLGGLVADCYPISLKVDYGNDASRIAVMYFIIEIITGG
jgi:hypothetical protein